MQNIATYLSCGPGARSRAGVALAGLILAGSVLAGCGAAPRGAGGPAPAGTTLPVATVQPSPTPSPVPTIAPSPTVPPVAAVPPTATETPQVYAIIDWVNFIYFGGITYVENFDNSAHPLTESDLGSQFGTVQFKYGDSVHEPDYMSKHGKDGDAAFLEPGTVVYTVKGYQPTFRLAARMDDRIALYEANTNPHAQKGGDLLDIGGKVTRIGVNSEQDGTTELGTINDPAQVAALVQLVLDAPVDASQSVMDGTGYFVVFYLQDGTVVKRSYWSDTGEMTRGIHLPKPFASAVIQAVTRLPLDQSP